MKVIEVEKLVRDFKDTEDDATPWSVDEIINFIEDTPSSVEGCSNCLYCTRLRDKDKRWLCEELKIFVNKDGDFCSKWEKGNRL